MSDLDGLDAYSPVEIARRIESVGEAKARMAALPLALLGVLVFASGHTSLNGGAIGQQVVQIAVATQEQPFFTALVRGVLCNVLVCMAVWMAMAGRSVTDKAVAVVLPVMAFVAAGFEHSIANMYLMPLAMLLQHGGLTGHAAVTWGGMLGNLLPVILGNVLGGAVLVAGVYHVIYKRQPQS